MIDQIAFLRSIFNLTAVADANGHTAGYGYYDPGGISASLNVFVKALKAYDVVKTVTYPGIAAPAAFAYDAVLDNLRTVTDLRGHGTTIHLRRQEQHRNRDR